MSGKNAPHMAWPDMLYSVLVSPQFAKAFSTVVVATVLLSTLLKTLLGPAGFATTISCELLLGLAVLITRRRQIHWGNGIPYTLWLFVCWAAMTLFWTFSVDRSFQGLMLLVANAGLGLIVASLRDLAQLIRVFADASRLVLAISIILEAAAGLFLDMPFPWLGIEGNLAHGGPIQGIFGDRTYLSIFSLVAMVTFMIEHKTLLVSKSTSWISYSLAVSSLIFSATPILWAIAVLVTLSALAFVMIRKLAPLRRRNTQIALLSGMVVFLLLSWALRSQIIQILNEQGFMTERITLWRNLWVYIKMRPLQGWGLSGTWPEAGLPFNVIRYISGVKSSTALNGYLDIWLQLGLIGLGIFLVALGLGLVRSWVLALRKKSALYVWLPFMFILLTLSGFIESVPLTPLGIFILSLVCTKSALGMREMK